MTVQPNKKTIENNRKQYFIFIFEYFISIADLIENRGCHNSSSVVNSRQGFLQSPGYPAATDYHPCHWRIIAQPSAAVHLILHDLVHVVPQSKGKCEGGLVLQVINKMTIIVEASVVTS